MNIKDAKNEIIHTLAAYLKKDDRGINRRVSVHIMGAKTGINPLHIY